MNSVLSEKTERACRSAITSSYQIEIIDNPADFARMATEWNNLLARAGLGNLSLRHEWLNAWIRFFPAKLLIILVRNDSGRLIGGAPLEIRRITRGVCQRGLRSLQFLGTELALYDWIKIPVDADESQFKVLQAIASALLQERKHWDQLDLQCFADKEQAEMLAKMLRARTFFQQTEQIGSMPYMSLPAEVEYYEDRQRKKRLTQDLRRNCNRLKAEREMAPTLEYAIPSPETEAWLEDFFNQHVDYWQLRGKKSKFTLYPQLKNFYKEVFNATWSNHQQAEPSLVFSILRGGDANLSYHLGFFQDNSYFYYIGCYNQAYKKYRPGILHLDALIRDMIRQKKTRFDFGRGEESYKELWSQDKHLLWSVRGFKNPVGYALWKIDDALKRLRR